MKSRSSQRACTLYCIIIFVLYQSISFGQSKHKVFIQNIMSATPLISINPSIYTFENRHSISLNGHNHYGIKNLNTITAIGVYSPNHKNIIHSKAQFILFNQLYESNIQLGYSHKLLHNLSGGVSFKYVQTQYQEYTITNQYNINISFALMPSSNLMVTMQVNDLYPNKTNNIRRIPIRMQFDVYYSINSQLINHISMTKNLNDKLETNIGLYYSNRKFYIKLNVNPQVVNLSYDIGYHVDEMWDWKIGNEFHHQLGISTKTSVRYSF